jgi:hypothetical protein
MIQLLQHGALCLEVLVSTVVETVTLFIPPPTSEDFDRHAVVAPPPCPHGTKGARSKLDVELDIRFADLPGRIGNVRMKRLRLEFLVDRSRVVGRLSTELRATQQQATRFSHI